MLPKQLLGFAENHSIIKAIKDDVFPKIVSIISNFDQVEIEKFSKYVLTYAKSNDINEKSRGQFYLLSEHIENISILKSCSNNINGENTDFEGNLNSENNFEAAPVQAIEDVIPQITEDTHKQSNGHSFEEKHAEINGNGIHVQVSHQNEVLQFTDLAEAIEDHIHDQIEDDFINENQLRIFRDVHPENDEETEEDEEEEEEEEEEEMEMICLDDEDIEGTEFMEEDEEDEEPIDPLEGLSQEELKKRLPPYYFMNNKKKKKFFNKLNENYTNKIQQRKIRKQTPKVNFKLENNQVKKFAKNTKVI
jgi:hypothetical protein